MPQRIDMGANRVSYDRMSSALETLTSGRLSDGGTVLRDLIIGTAYFTVLSHICLGRPCIAGRCAVLVQHVSLQSTASRHQVRDHLDWQTDH